MTPSFPDTFLGLGARLDDNSITPPAGIETSAQALCVPLVHLSHLRVTGADAADFLQNLLTNEARKLGPDQAALNGFCNPKGRLLASFLMWREGPDFCLSLARDVAEGILKKLKMYVLRSKVSVLDEGATRDAIGLCGPAASAWLQQRGLLPAETALATAKHDGTTVIRLSAERYQLVTPDGSGMIKRLIEDGFAIGGTAFWLAQDIAAGVPLITGATQEAFVPQMVNFELLGGVSFKKGCYPGQEIVARTQYLGKLKKRMFRARISSGTPRAGDALFGVDLDQQSCGEIVLASPTATGHEVLAVVQMSSREAGPIHLGSADGPVLEWLALPYEIA
ncbi:MAG: hypothetical protein RIR70_1607 [Pseudomonadota bacterium]|jgi:folate-binding protein YgfZ